MDNDTAKIGAQEIDHESPKEEVGPDLEEKIEHGSSRDGSQLSIGHAEKKSGTKERDIETAENEVEDPKPVKVPRSQRRGLFGRFTIVAEVEQPKHYSRRIKWYITFVVALAAVAAPMGSAIIFRKSPDKDTAALAYNSSFSSSNRRRPTYLSYDHQPLSRLIHAFHVDIPTLVVLIFRDPRTAHDLPHIIHAILTFQYPRSHI